jgi:SH3-like domain-containing protein
LKDFNNWQIKYINVKIKIVIKSILLVLFFSLLHNTSYSNEIGEVTGYKIPRFVSLKSDEVNLRIGSSTNYPIILKYVTKNMPVEITDEYERWRKIRDREGNEGWIYGDLLKGDRFAIIIKNNKSNIYVFSKPDGVPIGEIGKLNIVTIKVCLKKWCKIKFDRHKGWVNKKNLWGIYKNETINVPFYQPLINLIWKINLKN